MLRTLAACSTHERKSPVRNPLLSLQPCGYSLSSSRRRGVLLSALADDVRLFAGQLDDFVQRLFEIHIKPINR